MNSIEEKLLGTVRRYLRKYRILRSASILVAFSGGPDSVALVSLLLSLKRPGAMVLAYFDHGIRCPDELAGERELLQRLASGFHMSLETGAKAPGAIEEEAHLYGRSTEDLAREYRYAFLRETALRRGCDYIALGHNRDDQLETILIRVCQGSGPEGLTGIPERRGNIIRPLLGVRKRDIIAYLTSKALEYSLDSTNQESIYLRNRVRQELLPVVERIFPGYAGTAELFVEKMAMTADFIEVETAKLPEWEPCASGRRIPRVRFLEAHPVIRLRWIRDLYNADSKGDKTHRLPYSILRPLFAWSGEGEGILVQWNNITVSRRGKFIFWEPDIVLDEKKQYVIVVDKDSDTVIDDRIAVRVRLCKGDVPDDSSIIRAAAPPLIIRSKRDGDRLRVGADGIDLGKMFGEWRVQPTHRWMIPVLEDRRGIVAVLGQPLGYRNRYRDDGEDWRNGRAYRIHIEVLVDG